MVMYEQMSIVCNCIVVCTLWLTVIIMLGNDCDLRLKGILAPFRLQLVRCAFIGLRSYFVILFPLHLLLPMVWQTVWRNATSHMQYREAKVHDAHISCSWLLWIISTLLWLVCGAAALAVVAGPCVVIYLRYDTLKRRLSDRDFWAGKSEQFLRYCTTTIKPLLLGRDAGCMREISQDRLPIGVRNQIQAMKNTILFETCQVAAETLHTPETEDGLECPVCLEDLRDDKKNGCIIQLPCHSRHLFHRTCIEKTMALPQCSKSCPICRTEFDLF